MANEKRHRKRLKVKKLFIEAVKESNEAKQRILARRIRLLSEMSKSK